MKCLTTYKTPLTCFFSAVAANIGVNVVKAVLDIRSPYCVSFRLAVFETARGRLRASSYGFKASLWLECHLPMYPLRS